MSSRGIQAQVHEYEALPSPLAGIRHSGEAPDSAQLAQGMEKLVTQINERLRELYSKLYGRIALRDLNGATQELISNKLDGSGVTSWLTQNIQEISALISAEGFVLDSEYIKDKVFRGPVPPEDPQNGTLWLDQSGEPAVLKIYQEGDWLCAIAGMVPEDYYKKQYVDSQIAAMSGQIALKVSTSTYESDKVYRGPAEPIAEDGLLWLDTSVTPNLLRRWDGAQAQWVVSGAQVLKTENGLTIDTDGINVDGEVVNIHTSLMTLEIEDGDGTGQVKVTIDKNGIDTPKLTADHIRAEELVLQGQGLILARHRNYYWAPGGTGDGSTASRASGDLQALVDSIPPILNDSAAVIMAEESVWEGDLSLSSKQGNKLEIYGYGTRINGCLKAYHCAELLIHDLSVTRAELSGCDLTWNGGTVQAASSIDPGISMERCRAMFINMELNESGSMPCVWADKNSQVHIRACTGDSDHYLKAQGGSTVYQYESIPYGDTVAVAGLGQIVSGSVTPTHGSGYTAPPAAAVQTYSVAAASSRSHRGSRWITDTQDLFQGEYCYTEGGATQHAGVYHGCMWFPALTVPGGYRVTGLRLYLKRINGGGVAAEQAVRLWKLDAPAGNDMGALVRGESVGNGQSDSYGSYIGRLARDQEAWFSLPVSLADHLAAGKGLCLYTQRPGTTGLQEYIQCHGAGSSYPPRLEITMTHD